MVVLLFFVFWVIIPLIIVALFFDIEISLFSKRFDTDKIDKVNEAFRYLLKVAQDIKRKFK